MAPLGEELVRFAVFSSLKLSSDVKFKHVRFPRNLTRTIEIKNFYSPAYLNRFKAEFDFCARRSKFRLRAQTSRSKKLFFDNFCEVNRVEYLFKEFDCDYVYIVLAFIWLWNFADF